jgi:hypothetical protein
MIQFATLACGFFGGFYLILIAVPGAAVVLGERLGITTLQKAMRANQLRQFLLFLVGWPAFAGVLSATHVVVSSLGGVVMLLSFFALFLAVAPINVSSAEPGDTNDPGRIASVIMCQVLLAVFGALMLAMSLLSGPANWRYVAVGALSVICAGLLRPSKVIAMREKATAILAAGSSAGEPEVRPSDG